MAAVCLLINPGDAGAHGVSSLLSLPCRYLA